jgi:hypothetical protein
MPKVPKIKEYYQFFSHIVTSLLFAESKKRTGMTTKFMINHANFV